MKKVSRKSMIAFLVLTVFGLTLSKGLLYGININVNAEAEEDTAVPEYLHFTVGENNTPERYYAILKSCDTDYKGIVTIPDKVDGKNVKVIAQSAFMNCTGIENVVIPSSVDLIGKGAFYGCTGLKEITIPNGVGWIESRVFENCTGLTSISIPESVVLFGDDVFKGCSNLQTIDIPDKFKEKVIDIISKNATSLLNEINQSKSEKYTVDVKQMGFTAQGDNRYSDEAFRNNRLSGETAYYIGGNSTTGCGVIIDKIPIVPWAPELYGKFNVIDKDGKTVLSANYNRAFDWYLDDTIVSICTPLYAKETDDYDAEHDCHLAAMKNAHYYDTNGKEMSFTTGSVMTNGIAAVFESVSEDKNYGVGEHIISLINDKGEKVLSLDTPIILEEGEYTEGEIFYHGSNYEMKFGGYNDGLILFSCDRQLGQTLNNLITDKDGKTYKKAEHINGYANLEGSIIISQKYDAASQFKESIAKVGMKDETSNELKYGFIDKTGNYIVEPKYYYDSWNGGTGSFSEGFAKVALKEGEDAEGLPKLKYGYIDKTGAEVIPLQYEDAGDFQNGLAKVKKDGKWGYINTKGETVLPFEYAETCGSDGTFFVVGKEIDGKTKFGAVDADGNTILPFIFEDMSNPVNGLVYAFCNRELYSIEIAEILDTGDLSGDGEVSIDDVQTALKAYTEQVAHKTPNLTAGQRMAADINGDGELTVEDVQYILIYYTENNVAGKHLTWEDIMNR